jgi:hypothetical protein
MQIFEGIIGIILGFLMIMYAYPIKQFTGSMSWAEKIFGIGGTASGIKFIGVLVIIGSFLWITGTLPDFLHWLLGRFFPGGQPTVKS